MTRTLHIYFLVFALMAIACTTSEKKDSEDSLSAVPTPTKLTWPLADRTSFLNDLVKIKFKSGNIRSGYLLSDTAENKVTIARTADEGIYNLWEIQWVMRDQEVLFPMAND